MDKRIGWIDGMKALSIAAVVLYHTQLPETIRSMVYLFCLPPFFFCSGFFADVHSDAKTYFLTKTRRLLIPYLIVGFLSAFVWLFIGRYYGLDADANQPWWSALWGMLYGSSSMLVANRPLWFLCALIVLEWLFFAVSRCTKRPILRWVLIGVIAMAGYLMAYWQVPNLWSWLSAMIMLPIYALGYEVRVHGGLEKHLSGRLVAVLALLSAAGLIAVYSMQPPIHISDVRIGNPLLFYVEEVLVIVLIYALAQVLTRLGKIGQGLCWIGRYTLYIFSLHMLVFGGIKGCAMLVGCPLSFFAQPPGCLVLWLSTFMVFIIVVRVIELWKRSRSVGVS